MTRIAIVFMTGFFITSSLSAAIVLQSGATASDANTSGNNACVSGIAGVVPSAMTDMNMLLTMYESDCGGTLSVSEVNDDTTGSDCGWNYFANYRINEDNSGTCSGNAVLQVAVLHQGGDTSPPTGSFGPIMGVNDCLANAAAFDAAGVAAAYSDNCATLDATNVALTSTAPSGADCSWTVTYTYTVTDDCTNSVTGSYSVSGADGNAPSLTGTAYTGAAINDCIANAPTFNASKALDGYEDDCAAMTALTAVETNGPAIATGDDCTWSITYEYTVFDACTNGLTLQTYTETGGDTDAPTLTGAAYSQTGSIDDCIANAPTFNASKALEGYEDDCAAVTALTAVETNGPAIATGSDCSWTITYEYTVFDECTNGFTLQTYTDTGSDITAPTAVTQTPGTYDIDATSCSVTVDAADIDNGSTDNCSGSGVTLLISKDSMSASAAASVVLSDGPGADFDLSANCPASVDVFLHVIDACGNETISLAVAVSITANASTLSFPTSPIYDDVTYPIVDNDCNQNVSIQMPTVTTACGISSTATITTDIPPTDPQINFIASGGQWIGDFPLGTTAVTIEVTDDCGNVLSDTHNVTITDVTDPAINFCNTSPITGISTTSTSCDAMVTYDDASATDNCADINFTMDVTFGPVVGSTNIPASYPADYTASPTGANVRTRLFAKGETLITWTFTDGSNNTSSCEQVVVVEDNTLPTTSLPALTTVTYKTSTGATCPSTGTDLVTGNVAFGSTFNVAGQTITAPGLGDFADNCTFDMTTATLTAIVTVTTPGTPASCSSIVRIEWDVEDCGGNNLAAKVVYQYTIIDDSPPALTGSLPNNMAMPVDDCMPTTQMEREAYFNATSVAAAYSDVCQTLTATNVTLVSSLLTGASDNCSWEVVHTFNVNDGCSSSTSTTADATYSTFGGDQTAPVLVDPLVAPSGNMLPGFNACKPADDNAAIAAYFNNATIAAFYEDVCSGATTPTQIKNVRAILGGVNCGWSVEFKYDVEDGCTPPNKLLDETFTIVGGDQNQPTNPGPNYVDPIAMHNYCVFTSAMIPPALAFDPANATMGYTDDCATAVTASITNTTINGTDCGWTLTYEYTISDGCPANDLTGQTYSHSGKSQDAPIITDPQPDQLTLSATGNACTQQAKILKPTGTMTQCGGAVTYTITSDDPTNNFIDHGTFWTALFQLGVTNVTITAADGCSNMSTDMLVIKVNDVSPPSFTGPGTNGCPIDIVLTAGICDYSFDIAATDNCNPNTVSIDVTFSGPPIVPSGRTGVAPNATIAESYFRGITTVMLTATDPAGLSNSCSFNVTADPSCGYLDPCTLITEVDTDDLDPVNIGGTVALFRSSDYTTSSGDPATSSVFTPQTPNTIVPSGHNVAFYGGNEVRLLAGFEVQLGAKFLADIASPPCTP